MRRPAPYDRQVDDRQVRLSPEQARVVGSLIEKQLTTPQQYPLTLNALVLACNQSSNRDPVVDYGDQLVEQVLTSLKDAGLVRFVYPSHGRSVTRYRQVLDERLALDQPQLAILGVLLLRGPQTVGELRARSERMAGFDGLGAVEAELRRMAETPATEVTQPLVARLPRRPGQKEERWTQLVGEEPARAELSPEAPQADVPTPQADVVAPGPSRAVSRSVPAGGLAALEEEVATLRAEVDELRADLERLRRELGA
jgi:uncharacterized protein YceH (UPF0502 family)